MIYVSIDIETTGLDRQNDQVLEVGAVIEDTDKQLPFEEIPKYKAIINHNRISGSPYAINLNARIFEILAKFNFLAPRDIEEAAEYRKVHNIISPEYLPLSFHTFLSANGFKDQISYDPEVKGKIKIITAGKNFGSFDKPFLERMPNFTDYIDLGHKSIDPANSFLDFETDTRIPSLDECMKRAGVEGKVTHNALLDAWDVVRVLREKYV